MNREAEVLSLFLRERSPGVVEFLENNIVIPRKMSPRQPGPFSLSQRPMMRPILECWNPASGVNFVTVAGGTQLLKTTIMVLGCSYRIKYSPLPMMIMGPSADWCRREISEKRLQELINTNPILAMEKPSDGDQFRTMHMAMSGGDIDIVGANSPTALAGATVGILCIEEAAKIVQQITEEAPEPHPIDNAFERTKEFEDMAFHYMSSSPNTATHPFWEHYEAGDQTHFYIPCPHCKEYFPFGMVGEKDVEEYGRWIGKSLPSDYRSLVWSKDARDASGLWIHDKVIESTRYICPHCGGEIADAQKPDMMAKYEEKRHNQNAGKNDRSFHISSFYGPHISFSRIAWKFLQSSGDLFGLQAFYNSWLARTWELIKRDIKEELILKLKGGYRRKTIPSRPALLVLTADPGENATHWMVTAIMHTGDLFVIDWGTLLDAELLLNPEFLKSLSYPLAGTNEMLMPQVGYFDSGYATEKIYSICIRSHGLFWPTKGANTRVGSWAESTVSSHPGLKLYTYVDHQVKNELYGHQIGEGKGAKIVLPADDYEGSNGIIGGVKLLDPDSFAALVHGLTGQKLISSGNYDVWKKVPWDHYGDTLKLAKIASWIARSMLTGLPSADDAPAGREYTLNR